MAVNYPKKLGASHRQDGGSSEGAVGEFAQGLGRLLERVEADTIGNILAYEPEASATVGQVVVPTSTASGLAAGAGGGGGSSAATVVAIIAGLIALACAAALIALRRFGAW